MDGPEYVLRDVDAGITYLSRTEYLRDRPLLLSLLCHGEEDLE